jgi:hypothetical protein
MSNVSLIIVIKIIIVKAIKRVSMDLNSISFVKKYEVKIPLMSIII